MIFQKPMTSFNPLFTIGSQLIDAIRLHNPVSKKKAAIRAVEMLKKVGMPRAEQLLKDYPHQLSCGMRMRVLIVMEMACDPDSLIDVTHMSMVGVMIMAQI